MESITTATDTSVIQEETIIRIRKEKILQFLKTKYHWITYIALAGLVWLSIWIRTLNLPRLRDVTTGSWTLGPDLDPFLALRWAKYIVENGSLMEIDTMRYVPLGFETSKELLFWPYSIAWFHKLAVLFGSVSVEHSAVLYPVFMFAITVIAFFLLTQKIFKDKLGEKKASLIAIIASFFLIVIPSLLPRTIAGIPEKESGGFFFLFISLYLFIFAWKSKSSLLQYLFAILSAITTAMMSLIWGGAAYIYMTFTLTIAVAYLLGQFTYKRASISCIWLVGVSIIVMAFTNRFSIIGFLTSIPYIIVILTIFAALVENYLPKIRIYRENSIIRKIPPKIFSLLFVFIIGAIISSILLEPSFLVGKVNEITSNLITPVSDRLGVTVAENRQPFFPEWASSFGPFIKGIPLFFWLFFIGSIVLFYNLINDFPKKERWVLSLSYLIFLICLIFSRYKPESVLNGTNTISLFVYALGFIVLTLTFGWYYYQYYKKEDQDKFKTMDTGIIFLLVFFLLSIVSARGAVRLIMVLVPSASIIVSFFLIATLSYASSLKEDLIKILAWIFSILIVLATVFSGYTFFNISKATALSYAPSAYTQQWQKAMGWVRENTSSNAVFGHWWDYGYWVQSMGERATVLDGCNAFSYWDYLMGRYALTGKDEIEALTFLCTHRTTHFLIDSTDIGKYSAFSSIGSDENYDRASFIPTMVRDSQQSQETKNGMLSLYGGGFGIDEDIIYEMNETKIFLASGKVAVAGILVETNSSRNIIKQPIGVYIDQQNKRYDIPLRYAFFSGQLKDFGTGLEAGIFAFPRLTQAQGQPQIEENGALLYLSPKTVLSQLARHYLYKEENKYFTLVHSEDDFVVELIKKQGLNSYDFVYDEIYGGARGNAFAGPIRIWKITCPPDIQDNPEYLETSYPHTLLNRK